MVGKSARFLAPIALIAVALGVYLVVHSTLAPHSTPDHAHERDVEGTRRHADPKAQAHAEVLRRQGGDTLSGISAKTGVPVSTLTALNPARPHRQTASRPGSG